MKKLFTFFALLLVFAGVNAQRKCDLAPVLVSPGNDVIIKNGAPFDIIVNTKNLGPDAVKATDTIIYLPVLDGNYLNGGSGPLLAAYNNMSIAANGTDMNKKVFNQFCCVNFIAGNIFHKIYSGGK